MDVEHHLRVDAVVELRLGHAIDVVALLVVDYDPAVRAVQNEAALRPNGLDGLSR